MKLIFNSWMAVQEHLLMASYRGELLTIKIMKPLPRGCFEIEFEEVKIDIDIFD